jgi:hypothetical protein
MFSLLKRYCLSINLLMFKTSRIEGRVFEWVIPINEARLTVVVEKNVLADKQRKEKHRVLNVKITNKEN